MILTRSHHNCSASLLSTDVDNHQLSRVERLQQWMTDDILRLHQRIRVELIVGLDLDQKPVDLSLLLGNLDWLRVVRLNVLPVDDETMLSLLLLHQLHVHVLVRLIGGGGNVVVHQIVL